MTIEEMKVVDIRTVDRENLVDVRDIRIDRKLPKEERVRDYVKQVGNPYCFRVGDVVVKVSYEAIVSRDTFEKVRKILKEKGDNFHKGKIEVPKKEDKYHGLLFCGCCGRKMRRDSRMNHSYGVEKGVPHRVYNYLCVSTNDPAHDGIGGFAIMERKLDRIVFAVLKAQIVALTSKAEIDSFGEKIEAEKVAPIKKEIGKLRERVRREEYECGRAYEEYAVGRITREQFVAEKESSEEKQEKLKAELKQVEERILERRKEIRAVMAGIRAFYELQDDPAAMMKELLQALIRRLVIFPDGRIEITMNYRDWFQDVSKAYGKRGVAYVS